MFSLKSLFLGGGSELPLIESPCKDRCLSTCLYLVHIVNLARMNARGFMSFDRACIHVFKFSMHTYFDVTSVGIQSTRVRTPINSVGFRVKALRPRDLGKGHPNRSASQLRASS